MYYSPVKYEKKGSCDILKCISKHATVFQLMDSLGNVDHDISVVGYWIFDSSYKKAPVLNIQSLDMICASSVGVEQAT